jgi:hypothetical protein
LTVHAELSSSLSARQPVDLGDDRRRGRPSLMPCLRARARRDVPAQCCPEIAHYKVICETVVAALNKLAASVQTTRESVWSLYGARPVRTRMFDRHSIASDRPQKRIKPSSKPRWF